jgi:hypothetical protein
MSTRIGLENFENRPNVALCALQASYHAQARSLDAGVKAHNPYKILNTRVCSDEVEQPAPARASDIYVGSDRTRDKIICSRRLA